MNEATARELLMDYLYEEISAADKEKLERYLSNHPELQQELEQLQSTRSMLQQAPEVEPQKKLLVADSGHRSFRAWWHQAATILPSSGWGKAALAAAACLVFLVVAASVANLSIQSTSNGVSVHAGYGHLTQVQPEKTGLSNQQMKKIINKLRQDNTAILTQYAEMLNKQNKQQLQQVAQHFERQRANDLQVISKALNQYQQKTNVRFQQAHEVMGQMLQTFAATQKHQQ